MSMGSWWYQKQDVPANTNNNTSVDSNGNLGSLVSTSALESENMAWMIPESLSLLLPRTSITMMDAANTTTRRQNSPDEVTKPTKTVTYDFVILGGGSAGLSALRTLKDRCPSARIAIVDPVRTVAANKCRTVDQYKETATGFNPRLRTVQLMDDQSTQLRYKYGILLATGSRGAPPPLELFQYSALSRLFELRTTEILGNTRRPVLAPEHVRKAIVTSTSKGAKVAILGSGWDVGDLASEAIVYRNILPKCCLFCFVLIGSRPSMCHLTARTKETINGIW